MLELVPTAPAPVAPVPPVPGALVPVASVPVLAAPLPVVPLVLPELDDGKVLELPLVELSLGMLLLVPEVPDVPEL